MSKKLIISNNIHTIRAQMKTVPVEQFKSIMEKLEIVLQERMEFEKRAKQNIEEHDKKVAEYLSSIKKDGIEINELVKKAHYPTFKKIRRTRPKRPPKYKYVDGNGLVRTWTGQGRMPKPIRDILNDNSAKTLDDFLI